jgi:prepilin-type N-terminal cleavage/methylation domain-containing protein
MLKLKQRGDTIVEVMIVLAILGLAISISYATASRSLKNTRQAQENAEATELVRGQIEALRTVACNTTDPDCDRPALINSNATFCLELDGDTYTPVEDTGTACHHGALDYHVTVRQTNPDTPTSAYIVSAEWPSIQGEGNDTVTITYRLP